MSDKVEDILKRYLQAESKAGREFTGVGEKDGVPTISFYIHADTCASRKNSECDCKEDE